LNRLLEEIKPDEMIYLGRVVAMPAANAKPETREAQPGNGILLAVPDSKTELPEFPAVIQKLAVKRGVPITVTVGTPPRIASYAKPNPLPVRFAMVGVPTLWPVTPAETVSTKDLDSLEQLLEEYLGIPLQPETTAFNTIVDERYKNPTTLQKLVETYGSSGHEDSVRDAVKELLGPSLAKKTETDGAGNLILHFGDAKADTKTPRIAFVAHMDEIGYQVRSIENDGRLLVDVLGGGYEEYFLGHVALVHSGQKLIGGIMELPEGWEKPGFEWPRGAKMMTSPVRAYVGTRSAEETRKLGIKVGDWITIPKEYRPLLGTRANGRSFDDRVGCTVLIEAAKSLGSDLPGRDVTFIWSREEELGLKGAAAAAERMAKEGKAPDFVFAIDTFVSSDSPLESKRFADAEIGKGFVLRAVDNSNITPTEYVDRVVKLARENKIPVQYGVTGGGNDGSVFPQYGSVDIPLSWALRYAHSPGEVIDTRDVDALSKIVAVLAKEW
jgi:putative aminopeptidase FrvX